MFKEWIRTWLERRNVIVGLPPGQISVLHLRMPSLKRRGLEVKCAVDGGAASGDWTKQCKAVYPDATILCIEPRDDQQAALRQLAAEHSNIVIAKTLVGPREGDVPFYVCGDQSSVMPDARNADFGQRTTTPMTTIDALVAKTGVPQPDLIKLDLQGFELDALRGATECLKHASALMLELSFFHLQENQPLAEDVIAFTREHGFRLHDIPALWHRPLDGALAQGDFVFIKEGHPLLKDDRWNNQQHARTG